MNPVIAPPSPAAARRAQLARARALKGKAQRTPAESQELIGLLLELLGPAALDG